MAIRKLTARDGYIYTNGTAYGTVIELGIYDSAENWREIAAEEYEKILAADTNNETM